MEEAAGVGGSRLFWPDLLVITGYFLGVLAVGIWSSRKSQKGTLAGYFLASRNMSWLPIGASIFASNIGSGHFIGLAGAGAASGLAVHGYEQAAIYALLMLGWIFMPVYMSAGVYTMPEYLALRYGGQRIRILLSSLSLVLYIFTKIAADLYAGALFIQLTLNKSSNEWLYLSVVALLAVAGVFTIIGGLTTVVYTDLIQTVLMVSGSFVLAIMSIHAVGGYSKLVEDYPYATAKVRAVGKDGAMCGEPPPDYMRLLRSGEHGYSWPGMTFGMSILQVWYWCTDQVIVQRTLASRGITHGKGGTVLAAYLKYLPLWVMVFPGMAARILYPDRVACADPEECRAVCGSGSGCTNSAYIELVLNLLPTGLRGLMLAVMMAALMSSLTSVFNSASTIFTIDIWQMVRQRVLRGQSGVGKASEREMLLVGRVAVLVLVVISVVWIPVIQNSGNAQLFDYLNTIVATFCAPIGAIFVMALFVPRINERGAFWGLVTGMAVGTVRFCTEFAYNIPPCGSDEPDLRPLLVKRMVGDIPYMYFVLIGFAITTTVAVSVSLVTKPIPEHKLYRLTFWNRHDPRVRTPHDAKPTDPSRDPGPENSSPPALVPNQPSTGAECWKWVMRVVCRSSSDEGSESISLGNTPTQPNLTQEQEAQRDADFLKEPPFWRKLCGGNGLARGPPARVFLGTLPASW